MEEVEEEGPDRPQVQEIEEKSTKNIEEIILTYGPEFGDIQSVFLGRH